MALNAVLLLGAALSTVVPAPSFAQPIAENRVGGVEFRIPRLKRLPDWLEFSGEIHGRGELLSTFERAAVDPLYTDRIRLNLTLRPARSILFTLQTQDARATTFGAPYDCSVLRDSFDVRLAYFQAGSPEAGWSVSAGRQELSLGDERLLGADNQWDYLGPTFDGLRAVYTAPGYRLSAFTAYRVLVKHPSFDYPDSANRIHGMAASINTLKGGLLEPYLIARRSRDSAGLLGQPGRRAALTPGIRALGPLPRNFDYNVEMALQRGRLAGDRIAAWAGHWELGYQPSGEDSPLRFVVEYNHASGDRDPADGVHATFDDLFPASFNAFGSTDPFAWRNIKYPAAAVEARLSKKWNVSAGYRHYWLATPLDGLYPGGDEWMVRDPSVGTTDLGQQILFSAGYEHSRRWRFGAGVGQLRPGPYLRHFDYTQGLWNAYLLTAASF